MHDYRLLFSRATRVPGRDDIQERGVRGGPGPRGKPREQGAPSNRLRAEGASP